MDDIVEAGRQDAARPSRRYAAGLVASGLVAGLVVAGLTTATAGTAAQGERPAVTTAGAAQPTATPAPERERRRDGGRPGKAEGKAGGQGRWHRGGPGKPLHGEFTTRAPGGGFRTVAVQLGEATAVSATSITVRSEDGFTRTYVVDAETRVRARSAGITSIAPGTTVHVFAVVTDGTARALRVAEAKARPAKPRPSPTS